VTRQNTAIYQFKITLKYSRPPIWRRVQVGANSTLVHLHQVIQAVMEWEDYHLWEFTLNNVRYSYPLEFFEDDRPKSARAMRLRDIIHSPKVKLLYTYDFGDDWEHDVVLEKIIEPDPGMQYPVCVDGRRAAPLEDCGGMFGYYTMLEILEDPDHPDYEMWKEWAGLELDPDRFDLEAVNTRLASLRR